MSKIFDVMTITEVATHLRVHPITITRKLNNGELHGLRLAASGAYRARLLIALSAETPRSKGHMSTHEHSWEMVQEESFASTNRYHCECGMWGWRSMKYYRGRRVQPIKEYANGYKPQPEPTVRSTLTHDYEGHGFSSSMRYWGDKQWS